MSISSKFVSKNGYYFCNSEANRHEICRRFKQRVKINVSRNSLESVKFHYMKLTMMFKLI